MPRYAMPQLPSEMPIQDFVDTFHDIYEASPEIPRSAHSSITKAHDAPYSFHALLSSVFNSLPTESKLRILKAHPRLTGPTATSSSAHEQASTGLDRLSEDVFQKFGDLNKRYDHLFGWPFIIPVKDYSVDQILDAMERRLGRSRDEEFEEACRCVDRIAEIRIQKWFQENHPGVGDR